MSCEQQRTSSFRQHARKNLLAGEEGTHTVGPPAVFKRSRICVEQASLSWRIDGVDEDVRISNLFFDLLESIHNKFGVGDVASIGGRLCALLPKNLFYFGQSASISGYQNNMIHLPGESCSQLDSESRTSPDDDSDALSYGPAATAVSTPERRRR